jgi:uncharacterized protein YecT (DUF1311 family)
MKQRQKLFVFVAVMGFSCSLVQAQKRSHVDPCFDKAKAQVELNDCAAREARQADTEMNHIYQQ